AATIERIEADIEDSILKAPRNGRVQYVIARPGEVVGAGSPVLNLVDLTDVYMTFFLPEQAAGRVAIGSEARIVLDAAPDFVVPAYVSFVSSTAQFTPRTVETASERQKLMFRVRAHVPAELLERHIEHVKTGLPGVAWVKLDPSAEWPETWQRQRSSDRGRRERKTLFRDARRRRAPLWQDGRARGHRPRAAGGRHRRRDRPRCGRQVEPAVADRRRPRRAARTRAGARRRHGERTRTGTRDPEHRVHAAGARQEPVSHALRRGEPAVL